MGRNSVLELPGPRRAVLGRRAQVDRLLALAEHLPRREWLLLEARYRDGRSLRELAELMDAPPRQVARRTARILRRLRSPRFRFILQRGPGLPPDVERVGRHLHIEGRSLRETARLTRQSLHQVRLHAHTLDALARLLA